MADIFTVAKYKLNESLWWINLAGIDEPLEITDNDEWVKNHHPKTLFERGYFKPLWKTRAALPKLEKTDFLSIMHLLTCEFRIDEFIVTSIARSNDTGEFLYSNIYAEWLPESNLFKEKEQAVKEKKRIVAMIKKWCKEC